MSYLTIKTELSYTTAEQIMLDLLVQDYNIVSKDYEFHNLADKVYNEALLAAMRTVLGYYGGEQVLHQLEPQQQEMEM